MVKILDFIREVKYEAVKVIWPSRKDTKSAMLIVLALVLFFSVFFLLVDTVCFKLVNLLLGL